MTRTRRARPEWASATARRQRARVGQCGLAALHASEVSRPDLIVETFGRRMGAGPVGASLTA